MDGGFVWCRVNRQTLTLLLRTWPPTFSLSLSLLVLLWKHTLTFDFFWLAITTYLVSSSSLCIFLLTSRHVLLLPLQRRRSSPGFHCYLSYACSYGRGYQHECHIYIRPWYLHTCSNVQVLWNVIISQLHVSTKWVMKHHLFLPCGFWIQLHQVICSFNTWVQGTTWIYHPMNG